MKFTLSEIKKNAHNGPFSFECTVNVSELASMNNDIREINDDILVQGNYVLDGEEIIFSLNISGEMILPCARTLVDVPYSFTINEVEVFTTSPYIGKEEQENEIHPVEGEVIDLSPWIKEHILLAIPYRVFSDDEEAIKNAPFKGEGWEYALEEDFDEEQQDVIDPRLKKLQQFLGDQTEDKS